MSVQKRIINRICAKSTLSTLLSVLFIVNTVLATANLHLLMYINEENFYVDSGKKLQDSITNEMMEKSSQEALVYFQYYLYSYSDKDNVYYSAYREMFDEENSNFFFKIINTEKNEDAEIFSNYSAESGKDYYPDSKDFFSSLEKSVLIAGKDKLSFEGHIKKELTADDAYSRLDNLFAFINAVKYAVAALTVVFCFFEIILGYFICRCAGYKNGFGKLTEGDIDRIPGYILAFFYIPAFSVGIYFLNKRFLQLFDLKGFAEGTDVSSNLYTVVLLSLFLAVCLKTLLTTVSVRIKSPRWWQRSWMYRLAGLRKNVQNVVGFLIAAVSCELAIFMLSSILGGGKLKWIAVAVEMCVTIMVCYVILFVERNVSAWTKGTRRIAVSKKGNIPLQDLSGSYLDHAENINFLSRSASAETEKRYINESFSTKLINGISSSIKSPLSQVLELVDELKSDDIDMEKQNECIEEINRLSGMLKKTIEDIILISKATTGNLEINADYTDLGVFLSQVIGEYYGLFADKNISISEERSKIPVIVNADGQFMWYVFSSVFSVLCKNSLYGTRVHIRIKRVGDRAVLVFRSSVKPEDGENRLLSDGDLSLPTAKVFAELQGGDVHFSCKKDIMTVVLRFPLARIGDPKKTV